MTMLRIALVLVGATLAAPAQTNSPDTRILSLQECIQSALQKNLDLQIDRYGPALALNDVDAAYSGYDLALSLSPQYSSYMAPGSFNPSTGTVGVGRTTYENDLNSSLGGLAPWGLKYSLSGDFNESYGTAGENQGFNQYNGNAGITLSQPLLKNFWIDQTRLNIRVAKNRLKYSELTLKYQIMQTVTAVETAYYDLIYDQENVVVQQKAVELAQQLVTENKKRVEVGALAPLDEQQAEAQAATSEAALIAARSALAVQEHLVKQLITDEYPKWTNVKLAPSEALSAPRQFFNLQDSWSKGLTQRPDLLQAKLDIERQGVTIKYNYNQIFPELDVVGTYGHTTFSGEPGPSFTDAANRLYQGTYPNYSYGLKLTFPIPNTAARAAYRSSRMTMEQLVLTLKKVEESIMVAIDNDIKQAEANFQQVAANRTAVEYATAALDAEQKKLESGKSTTYTVLQMQRDLTTARGNEIQALDTYNKSLAQLSLDEGTTLKRLSILLEAK